MKVQTLLKVLSRLQDKTQTQGNSVWMTSDGHAHVVLTLADEMVRWETISTLLSCYNPWTHTDMMTPTLQQLCFARLPGGRNMTWGWFIVYHPPVDRGSGGRGPSLEGGWKEEDPRYDDTLLYHTLPS